MYLHSLNVSSESDKYQAREGSSSSSARAMRRRGRVAQSIYSATPGEEVFGSIPAAAPAPYCLGRCQYNVTD